MEKTITAKAPSPKTAKPKNLSLDRRMAKHGYVFMLPLILGFIFIYLEVLGNSFIFSFSDVQAAEDGNFYTLVNVGWDNYYKAMFVDTDLLQNLTNTIVSLLYNVPMIVVFSLFVATLLNSKMPGRSVFRTIFFIPAVLVTGAIAASSSGNLLTSAMDNLTGITTGASVSSGIEMEDIEALLSSAMLNDEIAEYLLSIINSIFDVVNLCGVQILIFISGLQSINPSVYEAASIEGANGWDCYWKITFPLLGPMIYVNVIYTIVDSFTSSSNVIMKKVTQLGVEQAKIGYASAYAWLYFACILVVLVLVLAVAQLIRRKQK